MSEGQVIWVITDEDAQTADDAAHRDAMAAVEDAWLRQTDLLATAYGAMLTKLPPPIAKAVLLMYAKRLLFHDAYDCADEADDDSDWRRRDE